jgi:subfamily B ATP-binding cassette protein MsbA
LWSYVRPHTGILVPGLACTALAAVLTGAYGYLANLVIDAIRTKDPSRLDILGLGILGVFLVKACFSFGQQFLISDATQKVVRDVRNALYEHLQTLSPAFFEGRRTGQLMSSITADVPVIQETFQSGLVDSIAAPVIGAVALGYMVWKSWRLTLTVLIVVPLMVLVIQRASNLMRRASAQMQERFQDISDALQETLAGMRIVQSFTAEDMEARRFRAHSQEAHRAVMRSVRVRAIMGPLVEFLATSGFVIVLWVGGRLVTRGEANGGMTFGALAGFLVAVNQVGTAAKTIGSIRLALKRLDAAAARIFGLLDTRSELTEKPDAVTLDRAIGDVEFRDVSFAYADGADVLNHVSFHARPGEVVAIVGASGAGKTTIASLVPRFYDVTGGAVMVDGRDVRDYTIRSLRGQIGIVPQETLLFSGTVLNNIRYGRADASEDDIRAAAAAAHADIFIGALPEGYHTIVGERGTKLSGGQRQRVAIARALLKDPRILILDEATSALDTESEALVQDALNRLMKGRTTLVIAHRLSTIRNADRILVMDQGRIVESGSHDALVAANGAYARLHSLQFKRAPDAEAVDAEVVRAAE